MGFTIPTASGDASSHTSTRPKLTTLRSPIGNGWRREVQRSTLRVNGKRDLSPPGHGGGAVAAKIRFINPETLAKSPAYTQVVEVGGPGRTVYVSGQLGTDRDGNIVRDFRGQAVQVFENLKAALAAVGASFDNAVKINSYLADIA